MKLYRRMARPVLFAMEPERAHSYSLAVLKRTPVSKPRQADPALQIRVFGLDFPNPIGLAAGFDKGAEAVDQLLGLGFGFVEVGTVTPLAQPGNPKPRLFRLVGQGAIVNRLGFNSEGHAKVRERLAKRGSRPGIVGVNLGANKDSEDRIDDYARGVEAFAEFASYFTINISSPNTPGLRDLQRDEALTELLTRVMAVREKCDAAKRRPVLLKIAPDITLQELDAIVKIGRAFAIDGLIISNTTIARPEFLGRGGRESGGLSGRPLFSPSTRLLAQAWIRAEGAFPLVGVGGVETAAQAFAKIEAGASLVQLYSSLAFEGPRLPRRIAAGLAKGIAGGEWRAVIGSRAHEIAAGSPILG